LSQNSRVSLGLLLLRGACLLLALTFGLQKLVGLWMLLHAGIPLSTTGLAPLIRYIGFPMPVVLAVAVTLLESVGAFLVTLGLLTRSISACAAISMAGALYTSIRLNEEPLRALLYLLIFAVLAIAGPGQYSLSQFLSRQSNEARQPLHQGVHYSRALFSPRPDLGLLLLRIGVALAILWLLFLRHAGDFHLVSPGELVAAAIVVGGTLLALLGWKTNLGAGLASMTWLWILFRDLHKGENWQGLPMRAALFAVAFCALAVTGAGRFSFDLRSGTK